LDKKIIDGIGLNSQGYKILLEILVKGKYGKCVEVPYTFTDRKRGKSKLDSSEFRNYLGTLYSLYKYKYLGH
jgi:dolichol-phosphate mannosyltransferase